MSNASRDSNRNPTILGVSSVDWVTPTLVKVNPATGRMIVDLSWWATTFTWLTDTPSAYTGEALKTVRVNAWETALEFATAWAWDVVKVWTPVDGQIWVWTWDWTIEWDAALTFDTTWNTLAISTIGVLSESWAAVTLSNISTIDATTEETIELAIDALPNLNTIQGQTFTLAWAFITSWANSLTLTTTWATNVTLPTSWTLVTWWGTASWTNTWDQTNISWNAATVTTNANLTWIVTSVWNATAIADKAISYTKLADWTDWELITWSATWVAATVAVWTAWHVLTSWWVWVAPTFQAAWGWWWGLDLYFWWQQWELVVWSVDRRFVSWTATASAFYCTLEVAWTWTNWWTITLEKNWVVEATCTFTSAQAAAANWLVVVEDSSLTNWSYVKWDLLEVKVTAIWLTTPWTWLQWAIIV